MDIGNPQPSQTVVQFANRKRAITRVRITKPNRSTGESPCTLTCHRDPANIFPVSQVKSHPPPGVPPDFSTMTSPYHNPRRRFLNNQTPPIDSSLPSPPTHPIAHEQPSTYFPLRKSSTFNSPTTPPSQDEDPIVQISLLPRRSPTCLRALGDAVAAGERRVQDILGAVDRSLSGLETFSTDSQGTLRAGECPVPRFLLDANARGSDLMDIDPSSNPSSAPQPKQHPRRKHHTSDSGLGSTVTGSEHSLSQAPAGMRQCLSSPTKSITKTHVSSAKDQETNKASTHSSVREIQSGINGAVGPGMSPAAGSQHALSEYACRHIQKHIISPIIAEESLKNFHPLVRGIPYRVGRKEITCLRDLEKVLLWLAPVSDFHGTGKRSLAYFRFFGVQKWSASRTAFLHFCETTIQCLHTTVEFLGEPDQRRPTDRPYTNGYFLDLTEQVRQYAAMITASRAKMAGGHSMTDDDVDAYVTLPVSHVTESLRTGRDERLALHGGLGQNGRPVELVRIKNGQSISLRTGSIVNSSSGSAGAKRSADEDSDEDPLRSMARRRKAAQAVKEAQQCQECDKVFKRPCDLT